MFSTHGMLDRLGITQFSAQQKVSDETLTLVRYPKEVFDVMCRDVRFIIGNEVAKNVAIYSERNIRDFYTDIYGTVYVIKDMHETAKAVEELCKEAYDKGYQDGMRPNTNDGNTPAGDVDNG